MSAVAVHCTSLLCHILPPSNSDGSHSLSPPPGSSFSFSPTPLLGCNPQNPTLTNLRRENDIKRCLEAHRIIGRALENKACGHAARTTSQITPDLVQCRHHGPQRQAPYVAIYSAKSVAQATHYCCISWYLQKTSLSFPIHLVSLVLNSVFHICIWMWLYFNRKGCCKNECLAFLTSFHWHGLCPYKNSLNDKFSNKGI